MRPAEIESIGISVIGAGVIGSIHAENFARSHDCRLIHIADADRTKAVELGAWLGAEDRMTAVDAVMRDERAHAVVIASSTTAHEEHVLKAVLAGKAILVENPIADNLNGAFGLGRPFGACDLIANDAGPTILRRPN